MRIFQRRSLRCISVQRDRTKARRQGFLKQWNDWARSFRQMMENNNYARLISGRGHATLIEGIPSVYLSDGSSVDGAQGDNCRATRRPPRTIGRESAQAGTEAKVCAEIRRPRPWRWLVSVRRVDES